MALTYVNIPKIGSQIVQLSHLACQTGRRPCPARRKKASEQGFRLSRKLADPWLATHNT